LNVKKYSDIANVFLVEKKINHVGVDSIIHKKHGFTQNNFQDNNIMDWLGLTWVNMSNL
jgi:hypothetical protein